MSDVVCQVSNQTSQVEFIWSSRGGYFRPYVVSGQPLIELRRAANCAADGPSRSVNPSCRDALEALVFTLNQAGEGPTPWESSYKLAEAGFRLFNCLLPTEDETAKKVRRWLEDQRKQSGLIGLEVVVEERSADAKAFLSVPWNLVYDERPAKFKAAFEKGQGVERWRPFWAARYNLTSGRRVEPLKRQPSWLDPRVVVVVDPTVYRGLEDDQRGRLNGFLAEAGLTAVGSMDELEAALEEGYPRLLYWLGHATPEYLQLGDERIAPGDLRNLLRSFDDRERPEGMLAFLNACQTAESGSGGSFLDVLHHFGFTGAIATERQTIDTFANEFGLAFLQGFLRDGKPLGELLHGLRLDRAPLGLLYGAHCPPEITVRSGNGAVDVPALLPIRESGPVAGVALGVTATRGRRQRRRDHRSPQKPSPPPAVVPPLPEAPYRSLAFYDEKDRALFTGRDADFVRFAATLDRPDTRILVLHGESGTGKSSFLRAGVIPYLEQECVGYRFLRRPDGSLLIVQAAKDLVGQLAQALLDATATALCYGTPAGEPHTADLRQVLNEALGTTADYATLREALRRDPHLLADVLTRMAGRLPHALVLVLDQAEEVFTLARTPEEVAGRDHALRMLQRLVDVTADVKLIVSLRTEYYGRLLDHLRAGRRDMIGVRDDLLREFSRAALIEAIARPASETPLTPGQPSPREKYGLRYAEGMPGQIADGILALRSENQDGVLPLVQVICTQLYEREKSLAGMDGVITREDLDAIKGVEGGLQAFAEDALVRSLRLGSADREAFKGLFSQLYNRQPDGTLTTWLMPRASLEGQWDRSTPFAELLEAAKSVRLLREDELRIEGNEPRRYVRLGHDALAKVAAKWDEDIKRWARRRHMIATVAGSLILAGVMLLLAVLAWRNAIEAGNRRREAQLTSANIALNRGLSLSEDGKIGPGLTWMARGLQIAPEGEEELKRVIRRNVAEWSSRLSPVLQMFETGGYTNHLVINPDGRSCLTAGVRGARLWDMSSGRPIGSTRFHVGNVISVAISPDGRVFATGSEDTTAQLWDPNTGRPLLTDPLKHEGAVHSIAFSPDGRRLLTGSRDARARLWDPVSGTLLKTFEHRGEINSVAFSPSGERIITGSDENAAILWNVKTGQRCGIPLEHKAPVSKVVYSNGGRLIATASSDWTARLWEAQTGEPVGLPMQHSGRVWGLAFSPDDRTVLTGSEDTTAQLWDTSTGSPLNVISHLGSAVKEVAFDPDGSRILTLSGDRIFIHRVATDSRRTVTFPHQRMVLDVAFSPDGKTLVTGSYDERQARIWDASTGQRVGEPMRHEGGVTAVVFSPDGHLVLTGSWDNTARLWDAHTGRPAGPPLNQHKGTVYGVAFSRDGTRFVTGSFDRTAQVWDSATMRPLGHPILHDEMVTAVAFSPDGHILLTGCSDGRVRAWDPVSAEGRGEFSGHKMLIRKLKYNLIGDLVLSASFDGTVRLWDSMTRRPKAGPLHHLGEVYSVDLSPDGSIIASSGSDKTVRFWDAATGRPMGAPLRHDDTVFDVTFSPDGRSVLTGGWDGKAKLWDFPRLDVDADDSKIRLWIETITALKVDEHESTRVMDESVWKLRLQELANMGGPPELVSK